MIKVLSKDIQSGWFNPPRRRRHLGNTLFEWTYLYFATKDLVKLVHETELDPPLEERQMRLLEAMPLAVAVWRAGSVREIVVSGLGLELYAPAERAGAYWLLREACEAELRVRERLDGLLAPDSLAKRISVARRPVLLSMRSLAHALFLMSLPSFLTVDPTQAALTFHKRHKLYLREEYSRLASRSTWPDELVQPNWDKFVQACEDALYDDGESADGPEHTEGEGESGVEAPDDSEVGEEGEGGEDSGMESGVADGEGEEGYDREGEESEEESEFQWGSAREELQNAADLLAQVDVDSIPFASTSPTPASSSSPSTPAPTSSLPWTSDLKCLYTSLRTAAHALAEIAPSSVGEVAEFDAGLLDWKREILVGGWVPGVRSREEAGR
ncbi:hypothetical protein PENSPDRAFT_694276 [Peniophora sp. CONT]|nr:hypothetical protein PENSPDRAFT_694276 [Peniophora sp. CONT]